MSRSPHPNFPKNLSITPNQIFPNLSFLSHGSHDIDNDGAFGIEAQREAISKYGIAGRIWESAHAMANYASSDSPLEFDPPFVDDPRGRFFAPLVAIELGSGTGAVAARIVREIRPNSGGFIIATDLPDVCPLLNQNLGVRPPPTRAPGNDAHTKEDDLFVRPLEWGNLDHAMSLAKEFGLSLDCWYSKVDEPRRLTHIICSDLVYFPGLFGPLIRTLIHLTSLPCVPPPPSSTPVKLIISYKVRNLQMETPFWSAFGLWFSFQPVLARRRILPVGSAARDDDSDNPEPWRQFGADDHAGRTFIFIAYRRPESMAWDVPKNDKDLTDGVGARGTPTKKGDETFETILFMSIDDT
ncbi:hypothetical protein PAXRUDRAFT_34878 [Paxillus rubicundulus Ve08.2h10]|uniref:Uncharacterized protein n=1 Tax=Paxillus rubicundulus Ve08.2h10 TaxID=930991 RepID=A0A0D0DYC9_9AGAM|nr:hypothetical protein PAXRUDRAFT_34878 [Paxillus rubicundulus Ve08.2h10]